MPWIVCRLRARPPRRLDEAGARGVPKKKYAKPCERSPVQFLVVAVFFGHLFFFRVFFIFAALSFSN